MLMRLGNLVQWFRPLKKRIYEFFRYTERNQNKIHTEIIQKNFSVVNETFILFSLIQFLLFLYYIDSHELLEMDCYCYTSGIFLHTILSFTICICLNKITIFIRQKCFGTDYFEKVYLLSIDFAYLIFKAMNILYIPNLNIMSKTSDYLCIITLFNIHLHFPTNYSFKVISLNLSVILLNSFGSINSCDNFNDMLITIACFSYIVKLYQVTNSDTSTTLFSLENKIISFTNFLLKIPESLFLIDNTKMRCLNEASRILLSQFKEPKFKNLLYNLIAYDGYSLKSYINNIELETFENKLFFGTDQISSEKYCISMNCFGRRSDPNFAKIVSIRNITTLINGREAEVRQSYEGFILFSASHEIRSQLNIINGYLDKIQGTFNENIVQMAKNSCTIIECKLSLLFDFVHILMNKFKGHASEFFLKDLIYRISEVVNPFANLQKVNFQIIQDNLLNAKVLSDFNRIFSSILHIVMNAIKFTIKGKTVTLTFLLNSKHIIAKIKDEGIGMTDNFKQKILEYITNNDPAPHLTSDKDDKLLRGIGLKASYNICKKLGGELIIESHEGEGTMIFISFSHGHTSYSSVNISQFDNSDFTIADCFPSPFLSKDNMITLRRTMHPKSLKGMIDNNYKKKDSFSIPSKIVELMILVVDDMPQNRIVIVENLKRLKYDKNVYEAENGFEAVQFCKNNRGKYNKLIIFMDIDMPIMNGIEASGSIRLKDKNHKIEIVIVSAFSGEEIIDQCKQLGITEFYSKPFTFVQLKEFASRKLN